MGQVSVWLDEEGDFLEVTVDDVPGHFNDLGNGVFQRIDENGETIGFVVLNITSRNKRELPFDAEFTPHSSPD